MFVSKNKSVKRIVVFLAVCVLLTGSIEKVRAAGELDPTFGDEGRVLTAISGQDYGKNTIIQPDGKILVSGGSSLGDVSRVALLRFNPDGSLDSTFDNDGKATVSITGLSAIGWALALQSDGKIVVSGDGFGNGNEQFFLVRFSSNGSLDTSFGNGGKVVNDFQGNSALLRTVAIQPDGKIVVAGTVSSQKGNSDLDAIVIRYNADGSLDNSFDGDGIVTTDITTGRNDYISGLLLFPDGKIIITGATGNTGDSLFNGKFAVVRYLPNGQLDASFGSGGKVVFPFSNNSADQSFAATRQTDGKTILTGTTFSGSSFELAVVRLNPDGSPDASFGTNGRASMLVNNRSGVTPSGIKVQSNGKIVVAGSTSAISFVSLDFAVVRFNSNGTLDTTFNGTGYNVTNVASGSNDAASGVAIQLDGKIIAAGQTYIGENGGSVAVLRYQGDPVITRPTQFDYDGDGKSDPAVIREGTWFVSSSLNNAFNSTQFGFGSDKIAPADYDGDGKTDIAVFRPSNGTWYRINSSNNSFVATQFGTNGDVPVAADYDGDGRSDLAVFRQGIWYVLNSSDNSVRREQFGLPSDKPVVGDFDGDGKSDLAVYRGGTWYLQQSQAGYQLFQFGLSTDQPVAADYNGDGKTDAAVYRDGTWFIANGGGLTANQFGLPTDKPVPADYDGDGKADIAVFRDGIWFRLNSSNNAFVAAQFGITNDVPAQAAFLP